MGRHRNEARHLGLRTSRATSSLVIGAALAFAMVYASARGRAREQSHGIEVEPYALFLGKSAVLAGVVLYFTYMIARMAMAVSSSAESPMPTGIPVLSLISLPPMRTLSQVSGFIPMSPQRSER